MTPAAARLVLDAEGHCSPVTGTTRFTIFHILHLVLLPGDTWCNEVVVAIATVVPLGNVQFVTEQDTAGIGRQLVFHRLGHIVTLAATAGNRKGGVRFVTSAAGSPFFHVGHGVALVPFTRNEYLGVAIVAAVNAQVKFVTEERPRFLELDLFDRVALFTIFFYRKSGFSVVTGAAGFATLHISHLIAFGRHTGSEYAVVAVTALVHAEMKFMTEVGNAGFGNFESHFQGRSMTLVAITLDGKCRVPFMAGATRRPFFHFDHRVPLIVRPGHEQLAMAVTTLVHLKVLCVTETGVIRKGDILDRVTLAAIGCHAESGLPIMAGAAGFTLFHLGHGKALSRHPRGKNLVVAVITLEHAQMQRMAEVHLTDIGYGEGDILRAFMASVATAVDGEGNITLMAGAA